MNIERYSRNIIIPQIGEEGQRKIRATKVLVCGAGGLGSTVIANLTSLGVGTIGIVDDDIVEISNLNRQYIHRFSDLGKVKVYSAKDWIDAFNPETIVDTHQVRLGINNWEIVENYDFIVDCFDSFESKFLLNDIAIKTGKPLIHGGVEEFRGQAMTILPGQTTCLRCILPDAWQDQSLPPGIVSPAATTIASIQSMEALKLILGIDKLLTDQLLCYDGLKMTFKKLNAERNSKCPQCRNI